MSWRIAVAVASLLLLVTAVASAFVLLRAGGPSDPISKAAAPFTYDLTGWEVRHLLNRWLYKIGHLFDDGPSTDEENERLQRYFTLAPEVASLERELTAAGEESLQSTLEERREEQQRLENKVEAILEKRVSAVVEDEGLTTSLPLFSKVRFVFPPLDFEFDQPPRLLVISPRERISLDRSILLRRGLTGEQVTALEDETAATGVSSLVVNLGGIATYPSTVPQYDSYEDVLETVAHEWLHQYLFFHPLGSHYFDNEALRTLNETVANIGGREIADLVQQRFPLPPSSFVAADGAHEEPHIDFTAEMHDLRLEVDRLLSEEKISEAEALMEEKREFLAENGFYIRKINQAYFAFHGLYGDTPASSSPIGPKMLELRRLSPSLGDFIRSAAEITSEEELDRLLAEREAESLTPP
ncbi:MAG: hypothetical protein AMJ76_02525 [Dehalococcoidia bacterium SM23_28_1]|nr:MAG: hypothetical protein AMJ76_02525 [Dehalococcoidia bacterium SM23_28_1]